MTDSERRRRRPAVSCTLCRRRKVRCNRESPCNNCLRSKNAICTYNSNQAPVQPARKRIPSIASASTDTKNAVSLAVRTASSDASTPASLVSSRETESIRFKIKELEDQLSRVDSSLINSPEPRLVVQSTLGGSFHVHESRLLGKAQSVVDGITHKTRTFGQSHWINSAPLIRDIIELVEPYVQEDAFNISTNMKKCKNLARSIKARRVPLWPLQQSLDLPTKDVADVLVDGYLQTIESVYRILHIPTFKRDYEAIWTSNAQPNPTFLIQLKLVLAIGATMYDDTFSLRTSAMHWVYEAQACISEPRFKSMLAVQWLQIHILLLIARETADVSCETIWISVGSLYRMAIQMGLHRDPALLPQTSIFVSEMRRRLWNTILEISMQSSLTSGGPPLITVEDFDTLPPGNFDDERLSSDQPIAKPESEFTQTSIAIALRKTLPCRLAVVKALNSLAIHNTYEATLQLDTNLRQSYKTLRQTLKTCLASDPSAPLHRYSVKVADIIMHHYLAALHMPYFGPAFHETAFAFSRKVVIDSSLKVWHAVFTPPGSSQTTATTLPTPYSNNDTPATSPIDQHQIRLNRLATCGSGFFRVVVHQASFSLSIELRKQLQEEAEEQGGLGPITARPDLLAVLEGTKEWCLSCIKAGETSIKGYVVFSIMSAQVGMLLTGAGTDDRSGENGQSSTAEVLVKEAVRAEDVCRPILEEAVHRLNPAEQVSSNGAAFGSLDMNGLGENWDFMSPDPLFDDHGLDAMNWSFGDDSMMQEPSFW